MKENKQLEKNVQEFLSLTGIESADKLLYTDRYPEEKAVITDLKRKHAFRLHIGKFGTAPSDPPRPSTSHGEPVVRIWCSARPGRHMLMLLWEQYSRRQPVLGGLGVCSRLPTMVLYRL